MSLLTTVAFSAFAAQDQRIAERLTELAAIKGPFTFVVIGDNRSGDEMYRTLIARAMEGKPAFIVNTGDQIARPGDQEQWAGFWEFSKPVTVPYFLTVGNHDVNDAESEAVYREQVDLPGNELYYAFTAGKALFIVLDSFLTGEQKKITGEQFAWLEGVLGRRTAGPLFLFLHHPLYPEKGSGRHYGNSLDRYPEDRDRLQQLLKKHHATAVFAGHEHLYLRKRVDGVVHITSGGGGAPLYAKETDGGFHHFTRITVDDEKASGEVIDGNGKVRDRFEL